MAVQPPVVACAVLHACGSSPQPEQASLLKCARHPAKQDGVTIGGKSLREHLEVINGAKAFNLMLDMARANRPITANTILALHEVVLAGEDYAGAWRRDNTRITGSTHITPNWAKVPDLMGRALEEYRQLCETRHPVVSGARLHYDIASIHPFTDGNGRTARLVNNLHLIQSGYPPVLLRLEDRAQYIDALEASHGAYKDAADSFPFTEFMIGMEERAITHYVDVLDNAMGIARSEIQGNIGDQPPDQRLPRGR